VYSTARQVAEAKRLLRKALKGSVDKLRFLDERKLEVIKTAVDPAEILAPGCYVPAANPRG